MLRLTGSSSLMDKTAVPLRRAWAERQAKEWADCLNCPLTVERSVFGVSNRETEGVS